MSAKTTIWLLVIVLLVGGFIFFVERDADSTLEREQWSHRALRINPDTVSHIRFETTNLVAECERDGDRWYLVDPIMARANGAEIRRIIHGLASLPRGEVIAEQDRIKRRLSLEDYGLARPRLRLTWGNEAVKRIVSVGRDAPLGDSLYVLKEATGDIMATDTNLLALVPKTLDEIRDRTLFEGTPELATRLEIRSSSGFIQVAKRDDGTWEVQQPIVARADRSRVQELLSALYGVRVEDFIADEVADVASYGLHEAATRFSIRSENRDIPQTLVLGDLVEGKAGQVYAKLQRVDAVYAVSSSILTNVLLDVEPLRDRRLITLQPYQVSQLRLDKGERFVELLKREEEEWWVVQPKQFKADQERVSRMVQAWSGARIDAFINDAGTNLVHWGLADPERTITFARQGGAGTALGGHVPGESAVFIGNLRKAQTQCYVRVAGETSVYTIGTAPLDQFSVDPLYFRDREVLSLDTADIDDIVLQRGGEREVLSRKRNGAFESAGEGNRGLNAANVDNLLLALRHLKVKSYIAENPPDLATYGLSAPRLEATFTLSESEAISKTVLIGSPAPDGSRYAMIRGLDLVFTIDPATYKAFAEPLTTAPVEAEQNETNPNTADSG